VISCSNRASWAAISIAATVFLRCCLPLAAEQVRVMQWNIHGNLGTLADNSGAAAQAIARIVNYNQPDVLLLNEVQSASLSANTTALINWVTNNLPYLGTQPGVTFFVAISSLTDGFNRNGAISRYPILNATSYDDGMRGLHAFNVQLASTNLQVFHAHLKCCSDGSSCTTKQTQAQFDSDVIKTFATTNSLPYIFGGDWNEDEGDPMCTLSATYHPITTIRTNAELAEFKPTMLNGQYRTYSTTDTYSNRLDYLLAASARLSPVSGYVFSTMDWAAHGFYTDISPQNLVDDSVTASDHYCLFADYDFSVPGPTLVVSPTNALTSTGGTGGPFSPSGQVYTLTNSGPGSLDWTAGKTAAWLTLSATDGTLAAGAATNVTVSINANANALAPGNYPATVFFTNANNGVGDSLRMVSLTVTSTVPVLSVTPASALVSSGPPGGPFSPVSQTYGLTNTGGATLNWAAAKTAPWLTLSDAGGTLSPGAGTLVTASINDSANSLAAGSYSDTITFSNLNNGSGDTSRSVSLTVSSFGFFDDFSTFAPGNLVGQNDWVQYSTPSGAPLQVSAGEVRIPGGQTANNQDAYKDFTQTNGTVFYGLTLTVNEAVTSASPTYSTALYTGNNATGYANYRLTARAGDAYQTNYVLGIRITGEAGDPYTFGATTLNTGVQYRVIVEAPAGGTTMSVYVDPTSGDLSAQTPHAVNFIGGGTAPTSVGSFVISQYGTFSVPTDDVAIGKVVISDSFAAVYDALTGVVPPPIASFTASPTAGTEPLAVTFSDASTGDITNRTWIFGDGAATNTTAINVTHVYMAGTYDVTLVATGPGGANTNSQQNLVAALTPFESWQVLYFGSTTNTNAAAAADTDNDGLNSWGEFLAGTIPTNGVSVLRVTAVAQESDDLRVTWTMGSGKTNVLQRADSVGGAGGFADVFTVFTSGSVTNYLDAGAATNGPALYYRVRLGP